MKKLQQYFINYFRWFRSFNITHASEAKQRKVAKEWTGEDIVVEMTPFRFDDDKKQSTISEAPWGYVGDGNRHIISYLDSLYR